MDDISVETLLPGKKSRFSRVWKKGVWAWMMTDAPAEDEDHKHTTDIEGLEQRRGSLHLAQLKGEEEDFFNLIERGNVDALDKFLNDHRSLNINCTDYKGLSALHIAIKKENLAAVQLLFRRRDLDIKDAALHAVATGNPDLTEAILQAINKVTPGGEFQRCEESADYGAYITPLILAAHLGDYEMVRMLLKRNHKIEKPHAPSCICAKCKEIMREAGSMFALIRLDTYKAICSPAYIVQVTNDPILYGFLLDRELKACAITDKELKTEYGELSQQVRDFTVSLLSKCRNTAEIETILKLPWGYEGTHERIEFPRLQLAIDYKQKEFVADTMVQQVLSSYWLGDFIKWPRLHLYHKCLYVLSRAILLPFICFIYLASPDLKIIRKFKAPINRYLLNLASYLLFLFFVFMLNILDTGNFNRGPPNTGFEVLIVIYVFGFIFSTFRQFFVEGWKRYLCVPWHWYDLTLETLYIVIFILWLKSFLDVSSDEMNKKKPQERKFWHKYDATLLHEGLFVIASILSFGKLAYFCLQSSRLGPLQVSMGKMVTQIAYFLLFCFLLIFSFAVPITRSYAYYAGMTQTKSGSTRSQLSSFNTVSHSIATFFWAMFCMSPTESTDVVVENLVKDSANPVINTHDFTETVGIILFGTYHLIMVIALLNTLIAILSNTFQKVVDNADVEFKYARAELWSNYFHESSTIPSPFNLLLSMRNVTWCLNYCQALGGKMPGAKASWSITRCCYIIYDKEAEFDVSAYETLIVNLVQRYFSAKEEE